MFLKRITACGFKSFCDRIDFDFGPGVTCIVGPNGCGKSNVVDAVKWVLGEQSARSLRGRQMGDMIFNGSSSRKAGSVAQVDLIFDNSDQSLLVEQEEIVITRKLYRSGESEYFLNHQPSRLKDIRELFLDTGVGVQAYSIIEQGKVDTLLQSNPLERRVIFDEAAGISRYKARRKEAERKLERTEQNLLRLADIVDELERRLRSVKLQAGKARNYLEYESQLRDLRSIYALAEYHRLSETIGGLKRSIQEVSDQSTELRAKINRKEAEVSQTTIRLDALGEQISSADQQLIQTRAHWAAQEERIENARHRIGEQQALLGRAKERAATDAARHEQAQQELKAAQDSATQIEETRRALHSRIDEANQKDQSLARELTDAQATLEDEKAGIIDLLRKSAQAHNEIIRLNTHKESLVGQKGRLVQREEQVWIELQSQLAQKAQLGSRLAEIESLISRESQKLDEKKAEAERVDTVRQRLVDEMAAAKERRSALQSRRELLQDLESKMEGVGAGARRIVDARQVNGVAGRGECILGLVAQLFDADFEHAPLIDTALGMWDQYLVVSDTPALLDYLDYLGELPGQVTVLCLDRLPPVVNPRDFSEKPGFVARAIDLVRYDDELESLAQHLLGKTIIVQTLSDAFALADEDVSGHRFVTLNGEIVEPDGRLRVGPESVSGGLISRKSELVDIDGQLTSLETRLQTLVDQLNRTQAEAGHLETIQQELRAAIYECNTAKVEANAALQSITEAVARLTDEQPLIAQEVTLIEQQIEEVLDKSDQERCDLSTLEEENKQREQRVQEHGARIDGIVVQRGEMQEQLTDLKVQIGQLSEKRAAIQETVASRNRAIRDLESSAASAGHDMEQCEARIEDAQAQLQTSREETTRLRGQIDQQEEAAQAFRRQREELRADIEELNQSVKTTRGQLEAAEALLHQHQMTLTESNVRRDDLITRVHDELSIDLPQRYAEYEHKEQDWEEVEQQIAELRAKMDRLGNVNLNALDELQELEERHGFLTTQRDDLTESKRQLEQLIDKLNKESIERFRKTYDAIREHFRSMFRRLFGGGRADIVLEDPDNILECGIEIIAQPPGKELQAISLMSGGEKSMTAIALLMSIFQSRPAPFTILDEVDAALDEANNERFNRIIHEFVADTQFIVITHSKWTMNTADRLYGITMQEPGVSTRVSVEFKGVNVA